MNRSSEEKRVSYPLRVVAALIAVGGLSVWSSVSFYQSRRAMNAAVRDAYGIGYLRQVLAGVATEIPPDAIVGYVSDASMDDPRGTAQFFGVQYALAPRLLVEEGGTVRPAWVIGVFAREPDLKRFARERGWTVVRELGSGMVLFWRRLR